MTSKPQEKTKVKKKICRSLPGKIKNPGCRAGTNLHGAENETRTRDPNLGTGVLYQLSYFRIGNNMVDYKVSLRFCQATFLKKNLKASIGSQSENQNLRMQ